MMIVFSLPKGVISNGDKHAQLSGQAKRALEFFLKNEGIIIPKDDLIAECWTSRGVVVSDNAVRQTLYRLRRALDDIGAPDDVLTTQVRNGYLLKAGTIVTEMNDGPGDKVETFSPEPSTLREETVVSHIVQEKAAFYIRKFKKALLLACVILICAAAGFMARKSVMIHDLHYTRMSSISGINYYSLDGVASPDFENERVRATQWLNNAGVPSSSVSDVYINPIWNGSLSMFICDGLIEKKQTNCSSLIIVGKTK